MPCLGQKVQPMPYRPLFPFLLVWVMLESSLHPQLEPQIEHFYDVCPVDGRFKADNRVTQRQCHSGGRGHLETAYTTAFLSAAS